MSGRGDALKSGTAISGTAKSGTAKSGTAKFDVERAARSVRERTGIVPRLAMILGSGLSAVADAVENPIVIPSSTIPGYPVSTVKGHHGRLIIGSIEGCSCVIVQGRVHAYEGLPLAMVTAPVRLVHALGATHLFVTNAAGGIRPEFPPGTLMWIRDHINWTQKGLPEAPPPIGGSNPPYDEKWRLDLQKRAAQHGIATEAGVYLWTLGPSYETKAEIRAFRTMGADAVGMSTVPEVDQARALGMTVAGLSTITNPAAGLNSEPLGHDEVMQVGRMVRDSVIQVTREVAASL